MPIVSIVQASRRGRARYDWNIRNSRHERTLRHRRIKRTAGREIPVAKYLKMAATAVRRGGSGKRNRKKRLLRWRNGAELHEQIPVKIARKVHENRRSLSSGKKSPFSVIRTGPRESLRRRIFRVRPTRSTTPALPADENRIARAARERGGLLRHCPARSGSGPNRGRRTGRQRYIPTSPGVVREIREADYRDQFRRQSQNVREPGRFPPLRGPIRRVASALRETHGSQRPDTATRRAQSPVRRPR